MTIADAEDDAANNGDVAEPVHVPGGENGSEIHQMVVKKVQNSLRQVPEFTFQCKRMIRRCLSFLPFFLVMAIGYATKEFYPLSSFPMYSKFDNRTYVAYLKDGDGNDLATVESTNSFSSQVKKRYGAELKKLKNKYKGSHFDWTAEQKTEAGNATLQWLKENRKVPEKAQLVDLRIHLVDGKIVRVEDIVGTIQ